MNPMDMEMLAGLPVERYVGRFIKARIPDQGYCRVKCIEALWGKLVVEIRVKGTKRHYQIPLVDCNPNWTENTDLKREVETAAASPEALRELIDELDSRKGHFSVPKSEPAKPPEPSKPKPEPVKPVSVPPSSSSGVNLKISPSADFTWVEDYKVLQQSIMEMEAIKIELDVLTQRERSNNELIALCLVEMAKKGVTIQDFIAPPVEEPPPAPEPPPQVASTQSEMELEIDQTDEVEEGPRKRSQKFTRVGKEIMEKRRKAIHETLRIIPPRIPHDVKTITAMAGFDYNSTMGKIILDVAVLMPKIALGWSKTDGAKKRTFTRTT